MASRSVVSVLVRFVEEFLYELKASPAGLELVAVLASITPVGPPPATITSIMKPPIQQGCISASCSA
jgi:hypothetical protein